MNASDQVFAKKSATERDEIEDVIENTYILDYGIVKAMRGTTACDVIHAVQLSLSSGKYLEPTVTEDVEILWPSSAQLSFKMDLAVGDRVLLVGLKHYLKTVNVSSPSKQEVFNSYRQETLKAIPLCAFSSSSAVKISVAGGSMTVDLGASGLLTLKNQITSLKEILDTFIDEMKTFTTSIITTCPSGAGTGSWAAGSALLTSLKAKVDALFGA